MEQENFEEIKESFFLSYKTFIDCAMLTHNGYSIYSILVLKRKTYNNLSKISITIRNSHSGEEIFNEYSNNVILPNEIAESLLNDIKKDFIDNHDIAYSSVNPMTFIQTLQNTKFSLNIKLNNKQEYEEAIEFNDTINSGNKMHRVLIRN